MENLWPLGNPRGSQPKTIPADHSRQKAGSLNLRTKSKRKGLLMKAKIPKSIREGDLLLGPRSLPCAVLEDGAHIISCPGFLKALGRPWRKTYKSVDRPGFLAAPTS